MRGEFTVADSFLVFLGPMRSFCCFVRLTTTWCVTRELKVAGGWGRGRCGEVFLWKEFFCGELLFSVEILGDFWKRELLATVAQIMRGAIE